METKYYLTKTPAGCKGFLYEVRDEKGVLISKRTSKRDYVACTADGVYYFGRRDLIGKGDHGRRLRQAQAQADYTEADYLKERREFKRYSAKGDEEETERYYPSATAEMKNRVKVEREWGAKRLKSLSEIAYLTQ